MLINLYYKFKEIANIKYGKIHLNIRTIRTLVILIEKLKIKEFEPVYTNQASSKEIKKKIKSGLTNSIKHF
jgi:hypothetical protein